jgi:hypothetical protein
VVGGLPACQQITLLWYNLSGGVDMSVVIRMHFDGKVFVPEEPVDVPINEPMEAELRALDARARRKKAREAWARFTANPIPGLRISDESLRRENLYEDRQ